MHLLLTFQYHTITEKIYWFIHLTILTFPFGQTTIIFTEFGAKFVKFFGGQYPVVLKIYSWLCAQESLVAVFGRSYTELRTTWVVFEHLPLDILPAVLALWSLFYQSFALTTSISYMIKISGKCHITHYFIYQYHIKTLKGTIWFFKGQFSTKYMHNIFFNQSFLYGYLGICKWFWYTHNLQISIKLVFYVHVHI